MSIDSHDDPLAEVFRAQRRALIGTIYNIVGCLHTAEDLVHDAYLRVSHAAALRQVDHLQPFLYQTARNLALDHVRRDRLRRRFMADDTTETGWADVPEAKPSLETAIIDSERLAIVERSLSRLPDRAKRAFILSRLDGLSYPEIAERLGVSESTVYNDIRAAVAQCLDALDDDEAP